jgi:branched-chain amino acid transport system permease protein
MTFGLAMVAEQALRMIFGAPPLSYSIPQWLRGQVAIGSFIYSFYRVVLLGIAATCIAGSGCCCKRPRSAAWCAPACRTPTWSARSAFRCSPICPRWPRSASASPALPACCWRRSIRSIRRWARRSSRPAFVVVVIGGLGSFWGVVAAALLVGLVKGVMVGIGYSAASTAAIYLLMLLVLLFRPRWPVRRTHKRFE